MPEAPQKFADPTRVVKAPPTRGFVFRRRIAVVSRWLHIYLSMVSFAIILFFAATGLTLNHPDWFAGHEQVARYKGAIPAALLHPPAGGQPDKLAIAGSIL